MLRLSYLFASLYITWLKSVLTSLFALMEKSWKNFFLNIHHSGRCTYIIKTWDDDASDGW